MTSDARRLLAEHHDCDRLLWDCYAALVDGAMERATALYAEFARVVVRHMVEEDELLFPPLAAASPLLADYVPKMLGEHAQLRSLMADFEDALSGADSDRRLMLAERLLRNLRGHTQKEELIVLPALETAQAAKPA